MAKKLRTREILEYLLDRDENGKSKYSYRIISKSLNVSQTTVVKINEHLNSYLEDCKKKSIDADERTILDQSDEELNRILELGSQSKSSSYADDYRQIVTWLRKKGTSGKGIYEIIQKTKEPKSEEQYFNLTEKGRQFLSSCKYSTFISSLQNYCKTKGLTNRLLIKPGEYMEIGLIDINDLSCGHQFPSKKSAKTATSDNPDKSEDSSITAASNTIAKPDSPKKTKRNAFYIYLPYSRQIKISVLGSSTRGEMQELIAISSLMMFVSQLKHMPEKIIGCETIGSILGKGVPTTDLHRFIRNCGVLYSRDTSHCVFEKTEMDLRVAIKNASKIYGAKEKELLQTKIDNLCREQYEKYHSGEMQDLFEELNNEIKDKPAGSIELEIGPVKLQRNNHVWFGMTNHYYSSKYTCGTPICTLAYKEEERCLYFRTYDAEKKHLLSEHQLYDPNNKYSNYSTNKEDLAPETEAEKYGMWTERKLLGYVEEAYQMFRRKQSEELDIFGQENPVVAAVREYLGTKEYKQQYFRSILGLCHMSASGNKESKTQTKNDNYYLKKDIWDRCREAYIEYKKRNISEKEWQNQIPKCLFPRPKGKRSEERAQSRKTEETEESGNIEIDSTPADPDDIPF